MTLGNWNARGRHYLQLHFIQSLPRIQDLLANYFLTQDLDNTWIRKPPASQDKCTLHKAHTRPAYLCTQRPYLIFVHFGTPLYYLGL